MSRRSSRCSSQGQVSSISGSCECPSEALAPIFAAMRDEKLSTVKRPSSSSSHGVPRKDAPSTDLRQPPHFSSMEREIVAMPAPQPNFEAASNVDGASTVSSNPSNWEGHFARKMLDMQWYFSANPLRVTDCSGRQWSRLHATSKQLVPQPGGGVLLVKQRIPFSTDEELYQRVIANGVGLQRKERKLPPLPPRRDLSTPELHAKTYEGLVPPLPKRPSKAPSTFAPGSSCFSCSLITGAKSKVSSAAGKSATSSRRSSSRQALQNLEKELAEERAATEQYSKAVDDMKSSLDALQALVEGKERESAPTN